MFDADAFIKECQFKAIRSSGSGGQHVNKTASKVELSFNVADSQVFRDRQKERLLLRLSKRLTKDNVLMLQCEDTRSQHKNKELVIKRALEIIKDALVVRKKRIPTKTPKSVIKKRLQNKSRRSAVKSNRKKPDLD
ncbi:alternative ribosome rescue aminoacyl-tRNA hydrolase ArfB [Bizionia paragorgiae]|uniref:alternative ribosome rescue aminoacyl-tRNA hydrolase ArfB n=1 Tax=Bizionia paragorgiae TaxID=283786 RepID=UPI00299E4B5E|nr:alternative ribosome rescue aminoacyl-tRNA hydrolase ArfB [Bizionia paragorgiae]MDX1271224.1 alternative ribosome rescue aminoacyl-tRNA hydrolase ArfB [Bizionia paragorgiae]